MHTREQTPRSLLLLHHLTHAPTFSSRLHSATFPMSQVIYVMAEDGLLFRALAQVRARTGAPIVAIMSSGNLAGE